MESVRTCWEQDLSAYAMMDGQGRTAVRTSTIVRINLVITEDTAKIKSTDSAVIVLMAGRVKLAVGRSFALVCHNMLLLLVVFKHLWRTCLKVHLGTPNCVSLNHFTHRKKSALKSFCLVIKRVHSVKIASLYL